MFDANVMHAISVVGLGIQTALTLLLALLFVVLDRAGTGRRYFSAWKRAWLSLLAGLVALSIAFAVDAPEPVTWGLNAVYQLGKGLYFVELAAGAWLFVAGPGRAVSLRARLVPFLLLSALSVPFLPAVERLMAIQTLLAVPALVWGAHLMATAPAPRRTAPVLVAAQTLGAMAVLWLLYLLMELNRLPPPAQPSWQFVLLGYNSYVDLLLQTLLAFAMVLVRAEDAQRELVAAHEALGEAHARLREKSLHDPLTGALNRRAFDEGVGVAPAAGGTVVAIDVDGLKPVNDRWGHEAGDAVLRHFATGLRSRLRESDRLYRTGGDEFVVVAPGADLERLSARVAEALATLPELPASGDHPAIPIAASWGAAAYSTGAGLPSALREADSRMYERKRTGRQTRRPRSGILAALKSEP